MKALLRRDIGCGNIFVSDSFTLLLAIVHSQLLYTLILHEIVALPNSAPICVFTTVYYRKKITIYTGIR